MDPLILTWRPTAWKDPQPTKNLISNLPSSTTISSLNSSLDSSLDSSLMILNHYLNEKVVDDNKNPGWIFCRPSVRLQEPSVPNPKIFSTLEQFVIINNKFIFKFILVSSLDS